MVTNWCIIRAMPMKPYEQLTHRGQVGRLKALALEALEQYPVKVTKISPLVHLFNSTFRVETDNGRFAMRINRPHDRSQAEIRSEMQWLAAIRKETPLVVPDPLMNKGGDLVTRVEVSGVPEPRDCVLFHWVDGRFYRRKLGPGALQRVGGFMARLHNHVQTFEFPDGFVRPKLQLDGEVGRMVNHALENGRELLSAEMCDDIGRVVELIGPVIDGISKGEQYNLIHADIHQGNYLFKNGMVRAIDFDDCGWGHFAYDIAITFWYLGNHPLLTEMKAAFLEGYRAIRPFPVEDEVYIDPFLALRSLLLMSFMATESNPRIRGFAPQFIASIHQRLKRFLESQTNVF